MNDEVTLYNYVQINIFLRKLKLKAVGCVVSRGKIGVVFEDNYEFQEAMRRWHDHEFR